MLKFRLPRKTKKKLKKGLWLYPADEKGNSLMAFPWNSQKDYSAYKKEIVRNSFDHQRTKSNRKEFNEKLDKEIIVSDEQLKNYINNIIREDLRNETYNILTRARKNSNSILAFYNFVNAYHLLEAGDESMGNICCMSIDLAKKLLKNK